MAKLRFFYSLIIGINCLFDKLELVIAQFEGTVLGSGMGENTKQNLKGRLYRSSLVERILIFLLLSCLAACSAL